MRTPPARQHTAASRSNANRPESTQPVAETFWQRWFPEGIWPIILLLMLVGLASSSVQHADWERIVFPMVWLGLFAAIVGTVLGKSPVLDSVAHVCSMVVAFATAFLLVLVNADELGASLQDRVRPLIDLTVGWYAGNPQRAGDEAYLVSMLMGIIVWLVGYLAAWTLFRRGWVLVAVLLPGVLVLINLVYAPNPDKRYLAGYMLVAIPLAARFQFFLRQREWLRFRGAPPASIGWKVLTIGVVLATLVTTIGWNTPASLSHTLFQPVTEQIAEQADALQARLEQALGKRANLGPQHGGAYSSFGESFSVGGPLNLSDSPEVLVQGERAPYLVAQRYDVYDGRGWETDVDSTFENTASDGRTYSPLMTFRSGQDVLLSSDVMASREMRSTKIVPLIGGDDLLLTTDTFSSADRDTSVQMSWVQVKDQTWSLSAETLGNLPPDVQRLASLLLSAPLDGEVGPAGPLPQDVAAQGTIQDELAQLERRFIVARWTATPDGKVESLILTGQLPVYDDVETVRAKGSVVAGAPYIVQGQESTATEEELMGASTDYPAWVTDRYLQPLPISVTPRTMQLAAELAPGNLTPYERAKAIETYLRTTIVYDETVSEPPAGADLVDYVLFERQRGYCTYYASAMAVMLRAVGVPARVVTGYYPGAWDASQSGYLYLQKNAHAWVEVFFPGYGWVPFEPTASQPAMEQGETEPTATETAATEEPVATEAPQQPEQATPSPVAETTLPDTPALTPEDEGGNPLWAVFAGGVVAAVIVGGGGWFLWRRGLRGLSPASSFYVRFVRLARFAGVHPAPSATPSEMASSFGDAVPSGRDHAERIVRAYEFDQYGPGGPEQGVMRLASESWSWLRSHAVRLVFRMRRRS